MCVNKMLSPHPHCISAYIHQHVITSHDETIHVLLLHGECGKRARIWQGNKGRGGDRLPTAFVIVGSTWSYIPFFGAVLLVSRLPSNARRHALCMATKTLTLLLLITKKLRVTGLDCAASDVCAALMPQGELGP